MKRHKKGEENRYWTSFAGSGDYSVCEDGNVKTYSNFEDVPSWAQKRFIEDGNRHRGIGRGLMLASPFMAGSYLLARSFMSADPSSAEISLLYLTDSVVLSALTIYNYLMFSQWRASEKIPKKGEVAETERALEGNPYAQKKDHSEFLDDFSQQEAPSAGIADDIYA